ncbi:MAG: hypothetical protein GF353_22115 [Candidatus Lokiarchaeota archaeon]|nr:hypothetical protein [Candidatus Lokiarchaeota archaeon]
MNLRSDHRSKHLDNIVFLILLGLIYSTSFYNFLLFHVLAELFSIIIAVTIFVIAWNSRKTLDNNFFLIVGISFLFVGFFDLIHTLAYKGMNIFPHIGSNLATQLWISARYIQVISLFAACFFVNKKVNLLVVVSVYLFTTLFVLFTIFTGIFPDCYVENVGLTPFKIISEYVIILIFFLSWLLLYRFRTFFDKKILNRMYIAIVITILSELTFTLYFSVFDVFNLIGHILKILAFFFIYKAIIQTGFRDPINILFLNLKQKEKELERKAKETLEAYENMNFYKDLFTHDISNIFQTLSSAIYISEMKKNLDINGEKENHINIIKEQIDRGIKLIDSIRTISNLEKGEVNLKHLELNHYLSKAIEYIEKSYQNRKVKITIIPQNQKFYIKANELLLEVFENIFTNAIKYNRNDKINIKVEVSKTTKGGRKFVKLEFKDYGIGIDDSKKKYIFLRGFKDKKGQKGMGMGLYLVKTIISSYDGKIWVQDRIQGDYSKGSNFVILLEESNLTQ